MKSLRVILLLCLALAALAQPSPAKRQEFLSKLSAAALDRTQHVVRYDGAYVRIAYPGGDVPAGTGVCTDLVIRAFRHAGYDLQKLLHEDREANPDAYPTGIWA